MIFGIRLLSTLPYPVEEFDIENPVWPTKRTPWTRTRHRMDALYGRDFNVANMEPEMLRYIDEHFGALSLKTVSRDDAFRALLDDDEFQGRNELVSRAELLQALEISDVQRARRRKRAVARVDRGSHVEDPSTTPVAPTFRHSSILAPAIRMRWSERRGMSRSRRSSEFLDDTTASQPTKADTEMTAYPPWIGPIITEERPEHRRRLSCGSDQRPRSGRPRLCHAAAYPTRRQQDSSARQPDCAVGRCITSSTIWWFISRRS